MLPRRGCDRPAKGRGLCNAHYQQWRKYGETRATIFAAPRKRLTLTPEEKRRRQAEYIRAWNYGMTVEELLAFFERHGNRCGICGKLADPEARGAGLVIDHDHSCCHIQSPRERKESYQSMRRTCGKCNRGLLCVACNAGIGQLGEDPERLLAAVEYLRCWQERDTQ